MKKKTFLQQLLVVTALLFPPPATAFVYSAEAIEGWVVDADTGKPVQGAIATANWQLEGGLEAGIPRGQIQISEDMTDTEGRFHFPAWGSRVSFAGHASYKWPQILIFKPGFNHLRLANRPRSGSGNTNTSEWNRKTVRIAPFKGDGRAYSREFDVYNRELQSFATQGGDSCAWRSLPKTLKMVANEDARLRSRGLTEFSSLVSELKSNKKYFDDKGCGPVGNFLRELGQQ